MQPISVVGVVLAALIFITARACGLYLYGGSGPVPLHVDRLFGLSEILYVKALDPHQACDLQLPTANGGGENVEACPPLRVRGQRRDAVCPVATSIIAT